MKVAFIDASHRAEKITTPLSTASIDVAIGDGGSDADIILFDRLRRPSLSYFAKKRLHEKPIVYRMRGNLFQSLDRATLLPLKDYINRSMVGWCDAVITPNRVLACEVRSKTNVAGVVETVGLPIDPDEWPTVEHSGRELRLITLTNMNYREKIRPLARYADAVNQFLEESGGEWRIFGDGHYLEFLEDSLRPFDRVSVEGHTEHPKRELSTSNAMLHLSGMDVLPNAILEGFASNLPVVTTDFEAFLEGDRPNIVCNDVCGLSEILSELRSPDTRERYGGSGRAYIRREHSTELIGSQFEACFERLVGGEDG